MRQFSTICILCLSVVFASQTFPASADEDTGYFLSLKQKGQLTGLGRIEDNAGIWYDIWICPGYKPPYKYAKKYFFKTGTDFGEYFHAKKYNDLAKDSKDAYRFAYKDCVNDFVIKGVPETWDENFTLAHSRTKKKVFGYWFAYPWAFMESLVESVFRVPIGLAGAVCSTAYGTVGVPAYYMTDSAIKGVWDLSINTITLPVLGWSWNTVISPPMALTGQKPTLGRADGFWMTALNKQQESLNTPLTGKDLSRIEQWGLVLEKELQPFEKEHEQLQTDTDAAVKKIREEQTAKEAQIKEREARQIETIKESAEQQGIFKELSEQGITLDRLRESRDEIREKLEANGSVDDKRAYKIMQLLYKFPPVVSEEKTPRIKKTDPVQRSIEIIDHMEGPKDSGNKQK